MRVLVAVVTGYLIFAFSAALLFEVTGQNPRIAPGPVFGITSVVWGMLFAALGGYSAARFAPGKSLLASVLVAGLIAAGALVSLYLELRQGSIWSEVATLVLMAPSAGLGGVLQCRRKPPGEA